MVEKIFTTFSQKLKGIERVSIINFEIKNCLYRIFSFVSIRFVAIILNEKHHMLGRSVNVTPSVEDVTVKGTM